MMLTLLIMGCVVISIGIYLFAGEKVDFMSNKSTVEYGKATLMVASDNMHYDFRKLIGRWLRPDGGHVIDIREIHADGKVDAGYYNPLFLIQTFQKQYLFQFFRSFKPTGQPGRTITQADFR